MLVTSFIVLIIDSASSLKIRKFISSVRILTVWIFIVIARQLVYLWKTEEQQKEQLSLTRQALHMTEAARIKEYTFYRICYPKATLRRWYSEPNKCDFFLFYAIYEIRDRAFSDSVGGIAIGHSWHRISLESLEEHGACMTSFFILHSSRCMAPFLLAQGQRDPFLLPHACA